MSTVLILHSLLRWLVLLFGVMTLVSSLRGLSGTRVYSSGDNKANLFFMITCDIQLLLGLALYFGKGFYDGWSNMANTMKDAGARFYTMEHEVMMLLAIVLVHVGRVKVKKAATDSSKFNKSLVFFGLAFLIILYAIPWLFRSNIGAPYFEWFN
jgi:hypothetical protein